VEKHVANITETLESLLGIDGAMAAAIVDSNSGMVLGKAGQGVDLELAGAGNTEVVRAKLKTMKALGLNDSIEDILITLGKQYHIIRPMPEKSGVFIYLVLDKSRANLALARYKTADLEKALSL
jgi:predicted regulator of Ras-like GTPase activity (Roadblock/LC7/MglB family)